jgi:hypothetical protein
MAVSLELLSFYWVFFERSYDAINALTCALKTYYSHRGFQLTDSKVSMASMLQVNTNYVFLKGNEIQEPFRHGLGHAVQ